MPYEFVAGDTDSKLRVVCTRKSDGLAINLSGNTVYLRWMSPAGVAVERAMTIVDAPGGVAEYQFDAGELFSPAMAFEIKIINPGGKVLRNPELLVEDVRQALP